MLQEINLSLLNYLHSFSQYNFIENIVLIFVDGPIFILPLMLVFYWLKYSGVFNFLEKKYWLFFDNTSEVSIEKKKWLILIFLWTIVALITSLIIQQFVNIDRPEQHLEAGWKLLLDHLPDASFPSDHATVSMAFWMWLILTGYKRWAQILLIPFLLMNISRVVAWVHWPFDILVWTIVWLWMSYITYRHIAELKVVKKSILWIINILKYIKL